MYAITGIIIVIQELIHGHISNFQNSRFKFILYESPKKPFKNKQVSLCIKIFKKRRKNAVRCLRGKLNVAVQQN